MQACAAISAAMLMACGVQHTDGSGGQPSGSNPNGQTGSEPGSPPGGPPASCPLGAASFTSELGLSNGSQLLDLAVSAAGNAFVAGSLQTFSPSLAGVFAVSAFGRVMSILPAGSQVAVDVSGNVFVAGSFTAPIDLGAGMMTPMGNIDVFIAKLDAKGNLIFAKQLGLCGDGLTSLAVALDGRIAVSGSAMGTAILSASGDVQLVLADAGFVAFDSKGNLAIAESLAGVSTILKVDASGKTIFSQSFTGAAVFTGIAISADDHIAVVANASQTITVFGTTIPVRFEPDGPGRITGGFLVELDSACSVVRVVDLFMVEVDAVAFDAQGNVFVAGADAVDFSLGRTPEAFGVDTRGAVAGFDAQVFNVGGRATGIAIDACAGAFVAFTRFDTGSVASPVRAVLTKLSE